MDRQITTSDDPVRALLREVSATSWALPEKIEIPPALIHQAIADLRDQRPLSVLEPAGDGPHSQRLLDAIKPIGALIDPKMERNDMQAWCAALVLALGDLPPRQALYGARAAVHFPMRFLSQVHGKIRECSQEAEMRRSLAEHRLKKMLREIEIAATPKLEKPPLVWDDEMIEGANANFKAAGISMRYESDGEGGVREIKAHDIDADEKPSYVGVGNTGDSPNDR